MLNRDGGVMGEFWLWCCQRVMETGVSNRLFEKFMLWRDRSTEIMIGIKKIYNVFFQFCKWKEDARRGQND